MTIEGSCNHGDVSICVDKLRDLAVTPHEGPLVEDLKRAESAQFNREWGWHLREHKCHDIKPTFSIPDGYVVRDGRVYQSPQEGSTES